MKRSEETIFIEGQCPICRKPLAQEVKPFCSRRCADIDLGRWFQESYTTPVCEVDDVESGEEEFPPLERI